MPQRDPGNSVAIVTLGCARNEVDSEDLASTLEQGDWSVVPDAADADVVLVNTCGFINEAKKDSIDSLLAIKAQGVQEGHQRVVAVGCLAERYGQDLARELPEVDAVWGFDTYKDMSARLTDLIAGEPAESHQPVDRRTLLPIAPVDRAAAAESGRLDPSAMPRRRLDDGPVAHVKLASGCDRRCSFCAIPRFRGSFVSRRPVDVSADITNLVAQGVQEVILVSENSTSYGKDLGDLRLLETVLGDWVADSGVRRLRLSYLQPEEIRPGLVEAIIGTRGVSEFFDLSFQHASPRLLRRMRRFGGSDEFLKLIETIRSLYPTAGIRSNFIVGFPGESDQDIDALTSFLEQAELDAIGVFGYSDEDDTEAATLPDKIDEDLIESRRVRLVDVAEELMAQRALARLGESVEVLIEEVDEGAAIGRAAHQSPDDGSCLVRNSDNQFVVGEFVSGVVVDAVGVDLIVEVDRS